MGKQNPTGYSADVRLWLRCGQHMIPLSHTAGTFVIPWQPIDLPPGDAEIIYTIDGARHTRGVRLVRGMTRACREVPIAERDGAAPF